MSLASTLRWIDAHPKTHAECSKKTAGGAAISVGVGLVIAYLVISEFGAFMHVEQHDHLTVDTSIGGQLRVNFNVTFPRIACTMLSVDVMDVTGQHHLEIDKISHDIRRRRLDLDGTPLHEGTEKMEPGNSKLKNKDQLNHNVTELNSKEYCGSCYGAGEKGPPPQCCNTCDEVRNAYRKKNWALRPDAEVEQCRHNKLMQDLKQFDQSGCEITGHLEVGKVGGTFLFAPGHSFMLGSNFLLHDLGGVDVAKFNISHTIHMLSFGEPYPGMVNPLDGRNAILESASSAMYQYFVKVVPTKYEYLHGKQIHTNQFSSTAHMRELDQFHGRGLPGVFFFYDLSPLTCTFTERTKPFFRFITNLLAIVGGVFTVAGMLDTTVYHSVELAKKAGLGKAD